MAQTGPQMGRPRHRSFVGPILLIVLGVSFLVANLFPHFDPWPILMRYWPLILIFVGLGKIWDSYFKREHPGQAAGPWISGGEVALLVLAAFFALAVWHGGAARHRGWDWDGPNFGSRGHYLHDTKTVDLQGAKSVSAELQLGAGTLNLSGGSNHLLDADFRYDSYRGTPTVDYEVSGDHGQLTLSQNSQDHMHFGGDVDWNLRLGGDVPIDLKLNMGAGESNIRLNGVNLNRLDVQMGVGELHLDLNGELNSNLEANIQGGVGSATIHLPKAVGVRVNAAGGIGAVNAHGLKRDGDAYVNDAYGKMPTTIDLTIHGGVGEINLFED
jgi:hypothetical protein